MSFSGDAGYPLEPWLMTPLPHYPEGTRQFQYTRDLCKARNVVERFFGCFKSMWRCLSYQRVLMYDPAFSGHIVNACAVLHNMRLHHRLPVDEYCNADEGTFANDVRRLNGENEANAVGRQGPRAVAKRIQRQIMRERYPNIHDVDSDDND